MCIRYYRVPVPKDLPQERRHHIQASAWYQGPALLTQDTTSCLAATNSFHSSGINPLAVPRPHSCLDHYMVSLRASLPLLAFRTQTEGQLLLEIFPNLSLSWVRLPSSEIPYINVCTCPSYTVRLVFCLIENISRVFIWHRPKTAPTSLLQGIAQGLNHFPLFSALPLPQFPLGSLPFKCWRVTQSPQHLILLVPSKE